MAFPFWEMGSKEGYFSCHFTIQGLVAYAVDGSIYKSPSAKLWQGRIAVASYRIGRCARSSTANTCFRPAHGLAEYWLRRADSEEAVSSQPQPSLVGSMPVSKKSSHAMEADWKMINTRRKSHMQRGPGGSSSLSGKRGAERPHAQATLGTSHSLPVPHPARHRSPSNHQDWERGAATASAPS
jgi:hypothetical protein